MKMSRFNVTHGDDDTTLIMNARGGGILYLNREYTEKYHRVLQGDYAGADDLIHELKRGGMLVDDDRDEYAELRLQSRAARFSNTSLGLTVAPTMACNFCCPYCYEKGQEYTTMSEGVVNQLPVFVRENYPNITSLTVGWYGGEPLLGLGMIERITTLLKDAVGPACSYGASIVTNGYLLTPDVARRLAACDVKTAQVTIDGSKADHDSRRILHDGTPTYERILQNIRDCADILEISIRSNVDKTNICAAFELLEYLEKSGLKNKVHFYLAPVDNINDVCTNDSHCFTIKEFSREETEFYRQAIGRGFKVRPFGGTNLGICCAVGINSYVVDPLGNLYKCWDDIGRSERKVGSIFEQPMLNANMIRWMSYEPSDPECRDCFAFPMCMGGCPNHALNGGEKQCVSFRYDAEQKMLLSKMMKDVNQTAETDGAHA
mgnify:FL=1